MMYETSRKRMLERAAEIVNASNTSVTVTLATRWDNEKLRGWLDAWSDCEPVGSTGERALRGERSAEPPVEIPDPQSLPPWLPPSAGRSG